MNNYNEPINKELAERLCNDQSSRDSHLSCDWLETEYRAHPKMTGVHDEVDLRMRGLGPLSVSDTVKPPFRIPSTKSHLSSTGTVLIVVGICMGVTALYSIIRRFSK